MILDMLTHFIWRQDFMAVLCVVEAACIPFVYVFAAIRARGEH